jgi:hypothetical protein
MADIPQTLALITLQQAYRDDIVRQVNRKSVILRLLEWRKGEGKNVAGVAQSSGAVAESYAEGADATNFGSDAQAPTILSWGEYRSNFHVTGLAMATAATSATPMGNQQLWKRNMVDAGGVLTSLINADVYVGNAANKIVGLSEAIGSVSNTYAGIDRTTEAYWRPYVIDPGVATALTFDQIRKDLAAIYITSGSRPEIALVHPSVLRAVGALFDPQKQYQMRTDLVPTMGQRGAVSFQGGVGAIYFDGCWFVEDKDAPNNRIHYLSTEHVWMEYLPLDLSQVPGLDDEVIDMQTDDGYGITPLGARLEMLSKAGDSERAMMKTYLQMKVDRPNACGIRYNVATT